MATYTYENIKEVRKAKINTSIENYKKKCLNESKRDTIAYKQEGTAINERLQGISNKVTLNFLDNVTTYDVVKTDFRNALLMGSTETDINKILSDSEIKGVFDLEVLKPNFSIANLNVFLRFSIPQENQI